MIFCSSANIKILKQQKDAIQKRGLDKCYAYTCVHNIYIMVWHNRCFWTRNSENISSECSKSYSRSNDVINHVCAFNVTQTKVKCVNITFAR